MRNNMVGKTMQNFDFIKVIGEGAWAVVYYGINTKDGSEVAIKAVPKQKIVQTPKLQELVKTEIKVLKNCKNENVIRFVDTFTNDKYIFIVTQFCNGGDLEEYLTKKKTLTEDEATVFLKHMLNGFKGLHQVGAMHRDFKVANVLLHDGVCKIADLGFAKQMVGALTRTVLGTSLTMAPEVLEQQPYGKQADIWSLGVVYYQMIYGRYVYEGRSDNDILKKIKSTRPDFSRMNISENCRDFIDKCLQSNPKQRITWDQIYQHPLIKQSEKAVKVVYNNMGKSKFGDNFDFYKKQKKITYPDLAGSEKYDTSDVDFTNVIEARNTVNYNQKVKQAEEKKEMQANFAKYNKDYLMRRNDLMFTFKFISPYVQSLIHIKANHQICMFIISKKALIEMNEFCSQVSKRQNIFKYNKYWQQFISSKQYASLEELLKCDMEIIYSQCLCYQCDISSCSKQISAQFQLDRLVSKNFNQLLKNIRQEYWYLLAEHLKTESQKVKQLILKVLLALDYLDSDKRSVQEFDRKMISVNMAESEKQITKKFNQLFE